MARNLDFSSEGLTFSRIPEGYKSLDCLKFRSYEIISNLVETRDQWLKHVVKY